MGKYIRTIKVFLVQMSTVDELPHKRSVAGSTPVCTTNEGTGCPVALIRLDSLCEWVRFLFMLHRNATNAAIAQLTKAIGSYPIERRFESYWRYHYTILLLNKTLSYKFYMQVPMPANFQSSSFNMIPQPSGKAGHCNCLIPRSNRGGISTTEATKYSAIDVRQKGQQAHN